MAKYFNETMRNCESYYKKADHNYTARMVDGEGFTARLDSTERTYFISTTVDQGAELVVMRISPNIHCSKAARSQVGEYIDKINAKYKCCNLRVESNGNLYIHAEQRFDDGPLSETMFKIMEAECLKILDTFQDVLDKLAHLKLIEPDEADVEMVIKEHIKKLTRMAAEDFAERFSRNHDDDDDDDNDDENENETAEASSHSTLPEHPSFREWLRKRADNGEASAARILARLEAADADSSDAQPVTLFDGVSSITDDEADDAQGVFEEEE